MFNPNVISALASSVMVRLGHHLGANRPERTKLCVTVLIGFVFALVDASLLYRYRSFIARNFATDPEVIKAIEELMGVACLGHFFLVHSHSVCFYLFFDCFCV
jgi:MATE family multidrug resistance protein